MPTCTKLCDGLEQVQFDFPNADNGGGGFATIGYFIDGDLIAVSRGKDVLYITDQEMYEYIGNSSNPLEITDTFEKVVNNHTMVGQVGFRFLRNQLLPAYWDSALDDTD